MDAATAARRLDPTRAPSNGCTANDATYPKGTTTVGTVTVGGAPRTFRVHVPPGYASTSPTPAVLVLHGGGGSGDQIETSPRR